MTRNGYEKVWGRGFTIVELLVVIVVIGILATIMVVAYSGITNSARVTVIQSDLRNSASQLELDLIQGGTYPATASVANGGAGLPASAGTSYQYLRNDAVSPANYCLTATNSGVSYHIASGGSTVAGPCPGHTGVSPTTLADGGGCPSGYIVVPGSSLYGTQAFCVMKYEAKNDGNGNAVSVANPPYPWVSISQTVAISTAEAACDGCHLITEAEWLTIAQNVMSVDSNWSGGVVGSGYLYSGHNDGAPNSAVTASINDANGYVNTGQTSGSQRRTLTLNNGEVIWDFAGNVWEWTVGATEAGNQPGAAGYAWRNWNGLSVPGGLLPNPYPRYANPSANDWTDSQNIGRVYSNSSEVGLRALLRGGYWSDGVNAGVFALNLSYSTTYASGALGFRIAK